MKVVWAQEKEKVEHELGNTKKEVAEIVEKFKASKDFMVEKSWAVANFGESDEFHTLYQDFSQESYGEGFNRAKWELQEAILEYFTGIKLDFLNIG